MMTPQLAVVTGAGQGIGRAIAHKFAGGGAQVVLVGRTRDKLAKVADEIAASGGTASVQALDITEGRQVQRWTAQLQAAPVDVLVNCAGEALVKPLEQTSDEELDRQLSINLKGQMLMTRALLPHLRQSANASIINIGSKTAIYGYANTTVYSAAKAGLLAFTRALAVELREAEIRVVTVNCGPVDTPMRWEATPNFDRKLVIAPEPVAELVWLLATLPRGTTTGDIVIQSVYNQ